MKRIFILLMFNLLLYSCGSRDKGKNDQNSDAMTTDTTNKYGYNRDFLKKYINVIELKTGESSIALIPAWQGRVMTSTAEGDRGFSFGWINHDLITSGKIQPHINAFGGEERLWLGPEGGQFSLVFKKGSSFIYYDWQTPAFLDISPFEIVSQTDSSALFACNVETENYSGAVFNFRLERNVVILPVREIKEQTGIDVAGLKSVAYRSDNSIINEGDNEWKK